MAKYLEHGGRQDPQDSSASLGFLRDLGHMQLKLAAVRKKDGGLWRSERDGEPYFSWMGESTSEQQGKSNYLMVGLNERAEGRVVYVGLYTSHVGAARGGEASLAVGYNIDNGEYVKGIAVGAGTANLGYVPAAAEQEKFGGLIAALIPHMTYGGVDAQMGVAPQGVDVGVRFNGFIDELKRVFGHAGAETDKPNQQELPHPRKLEGGQQ